MLEQWFSFRELSLAQLREQFNIADEHLTQGAGYHNARDLIRVEKPDSLPGVVYYQGEDFVIMRVDKPEIDAPTLKQQIGFVLPTSLRSRSGKHFSHTVYADKGIAFSHHLRTGEVRFVEVFSPMSIDDYKSQFYEEPGKFIR